MLQKGAIMVASIAFGKRGNNIMSCREFYEKFANHACTYKHLMYGFVAGYVENYVIIGFKNSDGCIKEFSDHVIYDKDNFQSFRFSKLKHIDLI